MDDPLGHQVTIGTAELARYLQGIAFGELSFLSDVLAEIAVGAVLENEVVVVRGLNGVD